MPQRPAVNSPADSRNITVTRSQHGPIKRLELRCLHSNNPVPAVANVFKIGDTLIDAGFFYAIEPLLQALRTSPPRRILLTHHHEDHIAALGQIRQTFGDIPVLAPRPLVKWIAQAKPVTPYRHYFWGSAEPYPHVQPYDAGDVFIEGNVRIESLATPGHCPHHCSFVVRDHQHVRVLSGDLYIRRKPLLIFYEAAADDAIRSLETLAALAPEIELLPNHLPVDMRGSTTLRNQAEWIKREAERVLAAAQHFGQHDYQAIAQHLYGPPEPYELITQGEITKGSFVRSVLDPVRELPATPIML